MSALLELKESAEKLAGTRAEMAKLAAKKNDQGKLAWDEGDAETFQKLNEQAGEQHKEFKKWEAISDAAKANAEELADLKRPRSGAPIHEGSGGDRRTQEILRKSIGQMVTDSEGYIEQKQRRFTNGTRIELPDYGMSDFKTLMTSTAGYSPFVSRGPDLVPFAQRRPMVQDLMPSIPISERGIEYMEETTSTKNAAPVAEGAVKPESARVFTPRNVYAEVMATTLPVTEQQLDDAPFLQGYINATLGMEVELVEESQILTGNGTSPQLSGFLTKAGVQTTAVGSDPVPTAFMTAITLIRFTGFAEPDYAVWHPNDWKALVTLQEVGTGRYLFGDPSSINVKQIWGVPAVVTPAETENTVLIGAFRMYSYIVRRMGLRIEVGFVNDDFARNQKTIRAETRLGLVIRRPAAFCKLTGA